MEPETAFLRLPADADAAGMGTTHWGTRVHNQSME